MYKLKVCFSDGYAVRYDISDESYRLLRKQMLDLERKVLVWSEPEYTSRIQLSQVCFCTVFEAPDET